MERDYEYEERAMKQWLEKVKFTLDGPGIPQSQVCGQCRHLYDSIAKTCAAFPQGIPVVIWDGKDKHTQSYPGDHGVQFEPHDLKEEDYLAPPERK